MIRPRIGEGMGLREAALLVIALGGTGLCFIGPALQLLGRKSREHAVHPGRKTLARPVSLAQKGVG